MNKVLLHIETAPLPIGELVIKAPVFKAASNLKDAAKITEDIEKKKNKYFEEAAYSENTGRLCAVAFRKYEDNTLTTVLTPYNASERNMIEILRELFSSEEVITFRGVRFVYPFIARRSAAYDGLSLFNTDCLYDRNYIGKINPKHTDLAQIWACGGLSHPETLKEITDVLGTAYNFPNQPIHKMLLEEENKEQVNEYLFEYLDALEDTTRSILC